MEKLRAGRGRLAVRERGAPLDRAAILAARDHFLSRIAALLEVHAAEHVEIDHLRDELLDRRLRDARLARVNVEPVPQFGAPAVELFVEPRQLRLDVRFRADPQKARTVRRIRHADQRAMRTFDLDVHAIGQCVEDAGERGAHVARKADGGDFRRGVRELSPLRAARTSTGASARAPERHAESEDAPRRPCATSETKRAGGPWANSSPRDARWRRRDAGRRW